MNQKVLPVISDWKTFTKFLESDLTWGIVMDFHINFLSDLIQQAHDKQKCLIVHMDLIQGLANDVFATQYVCQKLHVDGVISTKAKVVECAKQHHCVAILRLFMIDSRSIYKGCSIANTIQPDYLEILPAMTIDAVVRIRQYSDLPLIGGGLISTLDDIALCLDSGMSAISSSDISLCNAFNSQNEIGEN